MTAPDAVLAPPKKGEQYSQVEHEALVKAYQLHSQAMDAASQAALHHLRGRYEEEQKELQAAFPPAYEAAQVMMPFYHLEPSRSIIIRSAAVIALELQKRETADYLISAALEGQPPKYILDDLRTMQPLAKSSLWMRLYQWFPRIDLTAMRLPLFSSSRSPAWAEAFQPEDMEEETSVQCGDPTGEKQPFYWTVYSLKGGKGLQELSIETTDSRYAGQVYLVNISPDIQEAPKLPLCLLLSPSQDHSGHLVGKCRMQLSVPLPTSLEFALVKPEEVTVEDGEWLLRNRDLMGQIDTHWLQEWDNWLRSCPNDRL